MKIIIVDDEKTSAAEVNRILTKYFPQFSVAGIYHTMEDGVEGIKNEQPDLVLLDVQLDNRRTGFDLLERIKERKFEVIFITAYNKFAARAFQYSALHYIQKPIDETLFQQAVNRAIETMKMKNFSQRLDLLLNDVRSEHTTPQKIMVPNLKADGWVCLDVNQIVRVSTDSKQVVRVIYEEKGNYLFTGVRKYIGEIEKMLEGGDFIRIHESHIVNIRHIKSYSRSKMKLVMSDDMEVEISRRSQSLLMEKIKKM